MQRVARARVTVEGRVTGEIATGLLVLVGARHADAPGDAEWLARKVARLRIFNDEAGLMNRDLREVGGGALVVPQFTLYGDARKGRRPSFIDSARPEHAEPLLQCYARLELAVPLALAGDEEIPRGFEFDVGAHLFGESPIGGEAVQR